MKRKLLAIALSLLMTLSLLPTALAGPEGAQLPFTDVPEGSPYYSAVDYVYQTGLMNGVSDTRFNPGGTFSRAMFVTILGRMDGVNPADYPGSDFTDVSVKTLSWAAPYIKWASNNGIVNGYGSGKFGPSDPITKEQYCAVIARYADATEQPFLGTFFTPQLKDASSISSYAFRPVFDMVGYGLIDTDNGVFSPKHRMTRGEIAVTFSNVHRMLTGSWPSDLTTNYIMSNYIGLTCEQVMSTFSGENQYYEYWWNGAAKMFCDNQGYPPFDFAFLDSTYRGYSLGSEPVMLVEYFTGRGFPSVMAAPGIPADSTVTELQALGLTGNLYVGEDAEAGEGETASFYVQYTPSITLVFRWFSPGADPYTEGAEDVLVVH